MGLLKVLALTSAPAGRRGSGAFPGDPRGRDGSLSSAARVFRILQPAGNEGETRPLGIGAWQLAKPKSKAKWKQNKKGGMEDTQPRVKEGTSTPWSVELCFSDAAAGARCQISCT